jgi:hypothetical protein
MATHTGEGKNLRHEKRRPEKRTWNVLEELVCARVDSKGRRLWHLYPFRGLQFEEDNTSMCQCKVVCCLQLTLQLVFRGIELQNVHIYN